MLRQGFRSALVWLFVKRDFQNVRNFLSRMFVPFWPTYDFANLCDVQPQSTLATGQSLQSTEFFHNWSVQAVNASLDINPGSGEAFFQGRRPRDGGSESPKPETGPVDLLCHIFPTRLARGAALVLHCDASVDLASFVGRLLPRFFALDALGVPNDLLLLVSLKMAKQRYFQDSLIDQAFRPRPIEILRQFHLVNVETLHVLRGPDWDPFLIRRAADRFELIYGPFEPQDRPVFLCAGGTARAEHLVRTFRRCAADFFDQDYNVVDPTRTPLRNVLRAVARAPSVAAPNTGEAALLALVPSAERTLLELRDIEPFRTVPEELLESANGKRRLLDAR